jgi:hypothetical protein
MSDLLILAGTFLATTGAIEALVTRKLQSALGRVAGLHAVGLIAVISPPIGVRVAPAVLFWVGALTLWFGAKSHLESSILLWMVCFLRDRSATRDEILDSYDRHYGLRERRVELARAGFVVETPTGWVATRKGRAVVRLAELLR